MRAIRILSLAAALLSVTFFVGGCLTTESKEYRYTVSPDGSGSGTIKFINIMSEDEDDSDMTAGDFDELISGYLQGTLFEDENPEYNIISKNLFEENGQLCGEINFTFSSMNALGFYHDQSCDCSEYLFYIGGLSEGYVGTNGKYLGEEDDFPVITWPAGTQEFFFKTAVQDASTNSRSLLPLYNAWKAEQK
jgi:hypothetical protein